MQCLGAGSVVRAKRLLAAGWVLAFICALPQLVFWTSIELKPGWFQCTTSWEISDHYNTSTTVGHRVQVAYEIFHQSLVFWIPFFSLFISYLLIVIRVVRHTVQTSKPHSGFISSSIRLLFNQQNSSTTTALSSPDNIRANDQQQAQQVKKQNVVKLQNRKIIFRYNI